MPSPLACPRCEEQRKKHPQPARDTMIDPRPPFPFLALPYDIRHEIYRLLLVSACFPPSLTWQAGSTSRKTVPLYMSPSPLFRTLEPAILRTSRQVYHEASPVLYAQNLFSVNNPCQLDKLARQVRPDSLAKVQSVEMCVPWMHQAPAWAAALDGLGRNCPGLRYVEITWATNAHRDSDDDQLGGGGGLGTDVAFVRALARLSSLERLTLKGFYAKPWPEYLRAAIPGVRVDDYAGYRRTPIDNGCCPRHWVPKQWDLKAVARWNEETRALFDDFQRGTEHLRPEDETWSEPSTENSQSRLSVVAE